jgi:formylglycine-generating enzyme
VFGTATSKSNPPFSFLTQTQSRQVFAALLTSLSLLLTLSCAKTNPASPPQVGMFAAPSADSSTCLPTVVTGPQRDPKPHPGMVWIPSGEFSMGSDNPRFDDAHPWHRVRLHGFWISRTPVTNREFARFVRATGYVTVAERKPNPADFPGAPLEKLVPGSLVFTPPDHPVELNDDRQWWRYVAGASWRHPEGLKSTLAGRDKYPVVQIAYEDAQAYARWAHGRLPTEAEYEYAERGGLSCNQFAWGDTFRPHGRQMANTYHGHFPDRSTAPNGHADATPVGSFPPNGYGLYDMSGNVWEWTSDWYQADYYKTLAASGVAVDPKGPPFSYDPKEPGVPKRVQRGGSFTCTDQFCSRYEAGGRGQGEPFSAANHIGFRLAD